MALTAASCYAGLLGACLALMASAMVDVDVCDGSSPCGQDQNGEGCYCDALCPSFRDCCDHACETCGANCPEPPAPPFVCEPDELMLLVTVEQYGGTSVEWEVDQLNQNVTEYETLAHFEGVSGAFCLVSTNESEPYFVILQHQSKKGFQGNITIQAGVESLFLVDQDMPIEQALRVDVSPSLIATFTWEPELPCQQKLDCNGECYGHFFEGWKTDGLCDEGQSGATPSGGISFNCPQYGDDGGACDHPYTKPILPLPDIKFAMDEGSGTVLESLVSSNVFPAGIVGAVINAVWTEDPLFGWAIECSKLTRSFIEIPDLDYGSSPFTISFLFRHNSSEGFRFESLLSHGLLAGTNMFTQNSLNIFLPEVGNAAHGIMRFVLMDGNDPSFPQYYVDTDGLVQESFSRDIPGHVDMLDNEWHMATLVQNGGMGFSIYLDGRLSGVAEGIGGDVIDPVGPMFLCTRSDFALGTSFGGAVSNLQIWASPLSAMQVYQMYHEMGICDASLKRQSTLTQRTCCVDPANPIELGDVEFDNEINVLDVVPMISYILSQMYLAPCQEYASDLNSDLVIDILDVVNVTNIILAP